MSGSCSGCTAQQGGEITHPNPRQLREGPTQQQWPVHTDQAGRLCRASASSGRTRLLGCPGTRHGRPEGGVSTVAIEGTEQPIMILPQVHLRKPCYDFYFL